MRLDQVDANYSGQLVGLEGETWLTGRLRELGFVPGQWLQVQNKLFSGEPVIVKVGGTRFALRKEEAHCLEVEAAK